MFLLLQLGQDFFSHTIKKGLPFAFFLTYHAFKSREGMFLDQILLSDLRLDTYELKKSDKSIYWYVRCFDWPGKLKNANGKSFLKGCKRNNPGPTVLEVFLFHDFFSRIYPAHFISVNSITEFSCICVAIYYLSSPHCTPPPINEKIKNDRHATSWPKTVCCGDFILFFGNVWGIKKGQKSGGKKKGVYNLNLLC